jgi:hypothetical protein
MYRYYILFFDSESNQIWLSSRYEAVNFDDGNIDSDTDTDDDGDGRE